MSLVVVLPLSPGARDRARDLLRDGDPFDEVFITDQEALFLLEADPGAALARLSAADWAELSAGEPRVATGVYAWVRPHPTDEAFFTATPGPGDSEGGDLYDPEAP